MKSFESGHHYIHIIYRRNLKHKPHKEIYKFENTFRLDLLQQPQSQKNIMHVVVISSMSKREKTNYAHLYLPGGHLAVVPVDIEGR